MNETACRRIVAARSNGACEVCDRARATNMHHRRKAGRVWTPSNVLHVCGMGNAAGCHGHIETNPAAAKEMGWWLEPHQDPATVPVWLARRGLVLLGDDGSTRQETAA